MNLVLLLLGIATVVAAGAFMYLHNGEIWEAVTLSTAVTFALIFIWFLHRFF